jgi:hypothetical protein
MQGYQQRECQDPSANTVELKVFLRVYRTERAAKRQPPHTNFVSADLCEPDFFHDGDDEGAEKEPFL